MDLTAPENAARLRTIIKQSITTCDSCLEERRREQQEYEQLKTKIQDLPKKLSHEIMIPCGSVGFMPGRLVRTNELQVLLGDNYFAERSAYQTTEIIERRLQVIKSSIRDVKSERKLHEDQLKFLDNFFDEAERNNEVEIREEYDEEAEKLFHQKRKSRALVKQKEKENEELIARLDELENLERENGEINEDNSDVDEEPQPPTGVDPKAFRELLQRVDALMESSEEDDEDMDDEEEEHIDTSKNDTDLDSDDLGENVVGEGCSRKKKSKRRNSVHFAEEIEVAPGHLYNEPLIKEMKSILKNKEPTPVDRSKVGELEREASKPVTILPGSKTVFSGKIIEHETTHVTVEDTTPQEELPVRRISRFKQTRVNQ